MTLIKWLASLGMALFAIWVIDFYAIGLYELNLRKREVADRTNTAYASQQTARNFAGQLARQNAEDLEPFARRYPMDADVHVIRAANLRLIGRDFDAAQAYSTAVQYQPTPELYFSLGQTQLALGQRKEAWESFMRAVAFNPGIAESVRKLYETGGH